MEIQTKQWFEPRETGDGPRILIMRRRPRFVSKEREPLYWDIWMKDLGPSEQLRKDYLSGKITWDSFEPRYFEELQGRMDVIQEALRLLAQHKTLTLLCWEPGGLSKFPLVDEATVKCHRRLLRHYLMEIDPEHGYRM
jgi:uncharacterized protein YeaO (DUF488 family)